MESRLDEVTVLLLMGLDYFATTLASPSGALCPLFGPDEVGGACYGRL